MRKGRNLAEELVEGVLCFEGDVARLTHPHAGPLADPGGGAGGAAAPPGHARTNG